MTGSNIPPILNTPAKPAGPSGQVVQIVSLPEALENNARAVRVEGEVVGQNKDGTTRVKTEAGTIDISVRGRQPQEGAKIEMDIPPGSPPRQATIRPAPPQIQQPSPQQPPASSGGTRTPVATTPLPQTPVTRQPTPGQPAPQAPPTQGQTPPTTQPLPNVPGHSTPQTPVTTMPADGTAPIKQLPPLPGTYQPPVAGSPPVQGSSQPLSTQPPLPSLSPGQFVQIVPLPDQVKPMLPGQNPENTLSRLPATKTTEQANIIAQKTESGLITNLLQAVKSFIPSLPQTALNANTQILPTNNQLAAPLITPPVPSLTQPPVLNAIITAITSPSGQIVFAPPSIPSAAVLNSPAGMSGMPVITPIDVTVTDLTPGKQPIISIPVNGGEKTETPVTKNFIIQTPPGTLQIGTKISLLPQLAQTSTITQINPSIIPTTQNVTVPTATITPQANMIPPAWRALMPLMQPSTLWPAVDDIFQTFYQATPQAAQILGRVIPSPANTANFGPAALLFVAAMKSGDLQAWLGDRKLDMIHKLGKESLVSRLSGEASLLAQNADAAATDWKSYPIPLLWQNEISKVMLHVRQEADEQSQDQNETGTRFIMDLSLNRMGDVQLDGYVRGKRLDLIVRTELPISSSMQEAMKKAYADALDGSDVYGELGFQSDIKGWMHVTKREEAIAVS